MPRFSFPYPVKPWNITQGWGVYNPAYQRFGYSHHNGTDVMLGNGGLIVAPISGTILRACTKDNGNWQPQGGGVFVSILSDQPYTFDDGKTAYVFADFLHCDHLLVKEGDHVSIGDTIAIADNTGFSTGPHTHVQLRRETKMPLPAPANVPSYRTDSEFWLCDLDTNDANNSFDPTPYYTNTFALDKQIGLLQTLIALCNKYLPFTKGR